MCGINGVINYLNKPVDRGLFFKMRDSLLHRGPDDSGSFFNEFLALGHRRLAILDKSSNGQQPLISRNGRYVIIFNGEIYNFNEFKKELIDKGYRFSTNTDTEVLLYLYMEYGSKVLLRLNGMFAFAIWDNEENQLFIARDRVGVKPLYFSFQPEYFAFASEPKALFEYGVPKRLEIGNLNEWLFFRYVSGNQTLFQGVEELLPGHYMILSKSNNFKPKCIRWWNLSEEIKMHSEITNPDEWFKQTFFSSIRYRMISDVPIGVLLSGGLDSSSIAAAVKNQKFNDIQTFNVGFDNFKDNESNLARNFSKKLGFPFHSVSLSDFDIEKEFISATYANDEPLVHQNDPHLIAISRYAKDYVSVLLSGEGSDELMAGYVRYMPIAYKNSLYPFRFFFNFLPNSILSNRLLKLKKFLEICSNSKMALWNSSIYYPADFVKFGIESAGISNPYRMKILDEGADLYGNNTLRQAMYLDQHTYLCSLNNRNDRTTMAASIECREPFLDYRLLAGLGKLPNKDFVRSGVGKYLLRRTMAPLLGNDVTRVRKIGFSIPWSATLNASPTLKSLWDSMPEHEALKIGILSDLNVRELMMQYNRGNIALEGLLRQLLMFVLWHDTYLNNKL